MAAAPNTPKNPSQENVSIQQSWTAVYEAGVAAYEFPYDGISDSKRPEQTFGTLYGVFLPCLQNLLGVLLFLRLPWMVSQAGVLSASGIILICTLSTFLTTLSLSALATNGRIRAGGPYAIVRQNLGPEMGAAIGVLFYLGTTLDTSVAVLGGVEALFTIFIPGSSNCVDLNVTETCGYELFAYDREVIGIGIAIILGIVVSVGMGFVSKISSALLIVVLIGLILMLLGLLLFAAGVFEPNDPSIFRGSLSQNLFPNYEPDVETGVLYSFTTLIALFFPAFTDIMTGSNRSGLLVDPGKSIPKGTISAVLLTACFYLLLAWLFASIVANSTLKENKLITALIAWPHPFPVAVGIIMSSIGAALSSIAGAPQLLKSLANDGHVPFLKFFATKTPEAEPYAGIVLTTMIAALCCLAGNLDYMTPIITMFYLAMYSAINLSCFFCSYVRSPGFRPKWRYYHWATALFGSISCTTTMFIVSPLYAFLALLFILVLCMYVYTTREKLEWGDAIVGLRLEQATSSLLALSDISYMKKRSKLSNYFSKRTTRNTESKLFHHNKSGHLRGTNWRPQILVFCKFTENLDSVKNTDLLSLAGQLKKGRGLTVVTSIIQGNLTDANNLDVVQRANMVLKEHLYRYKIKGFAEVVTSSPSLLQTFQVVLQTSGMGPLRTNTVLVSWPSKWGGFRFAGNSTEEMDECTHQDLYVNILKSALGAGKAIIAQKLVCEFPSYTKRVQGTIHVWWLIHDGVILALIPYLLQRHKVWRGCKVYIYAIAPEQMVNLPVMETKLKNFVEQMRIEASVKVIPVNFSDARDIDENHTVYVHSKQTGHLSEVASELFEPRNEHVLTQPTSEKNSSTQSIQGACNPGDKEFESRMSVNCTIEEFEEGHKTGIGFGDRNSYKIPENNEAQTRLMTAQRLNALFVTHSKEAALIVLNLPISRHVGTKDFISYTEKLTENLPNVLLIRGNGNESYFTE